MTILQRYGRWALIPGCLGKARWPLGTCTPRVAYDHDEIREVNSLRGTRHSTRDGTDPFYAVLKDFP